MVALSNVLRDFLRFPKRATTRIAPALALLLAACSDATSPGGTTWTQVSVGDGFSCALDGAGRAWCWGINTFGQLGTDTTLPSDVPLAVLGNHAFRTIVAGSDHVCGIATDGALWCWGLNEFFQLGVASPACNPVLFGRCEMRPARVESAPPLASVDVNGYTTCGISLSGAGWCWGWSDHGQAGGVAGAIMGSPAPISGATNLAHVSVGRYHACAVTHASALLCWGANDLGQLAADSSLTPRCGPDPGFACATHAVPGAPGMSFSEVSAGGSFTCAIAAAGGAWCWGGGFGLAPVAVAGGFTQVDAGFDHACGIDEDGAAKCWAAGAVTPAAVATDARFTSISAGRNRSCGITTSREMLCWEAGGTPELVPHP